MTSSSSTTFGALPGVERATTHGLESVRVRSAEASGLVYLQGAHVAEWAPAGHSPVIWMSERAVYQPGKALRGGVPVCFPWFGANAQHEGYPAHGFARTKAFAYLGARLDDQGRPELEFSLTDDATSYQLFPHSFDARLRVAFGKTLGLAFTVTNQSADPFSFEAALHSYFCVSDVRNVSLAGLAGATYHDKVRGMAEFSENAAELRFSGETDRVYDSSGPCTIVDPGARRSLLIDKSGSRSTVVWNPWAERAAQLADLGAEAWPHMLCVESANVAESRILLAPGESHTLRVAVSVAPTS